MLFSKQTLRILFAVLCLGTTGTMLEACSWFNCCRHRTSTTATNQEATEQKVPLKQPQITRIEIAPADVIDDRPNCAQRFLDWLEDVMSRIISVKRLSNTKVWTNTCKDVLKNTKKLKTDCTY